MGDRATFLSSLNNKGLFAEIQEIIKTDLDNGVTVEFWLRKEGVNTTQTSREVIFDLWNGETAGSTGYGRLTIEYNATASASPIRFTLMSGTSGVSDKVIGSSITLANTTGTLSNESAPWRHYAVSAENSGSNLLSLWEITGIPKNKEGIKISNNPPIQAQSAGVQKQSLTGKFDDKNS